MKETWRLVGYDAFAEEHYSLAGKYGSEEEAQAAGKERMKLLEETQPITESGGQDDLAIQDRVFVQRPDGSLYRFIPLPDNNKIEP